MSRSRINHMPVPRRLVEEKPGRKSSKADQQKYEQEAIKRARLYQIQERHRELASLGH